MLKALMSFFTGSPSPSAPASAPKARREATGDLHDLEGFVDYVVRALVDYPNEVAIKSEETEEGFAIKITCRKEDIGKIVGKRGKTIMAIRSLVSGAAGRQRKRVSVEVLD